MTETSTSEPGGTPPPPEPPPPSPSAGRPPLRRDPDTGYLAGVAAGLANHLDVDLVLVRIGFVIVTLLTQGLGAVAYLLGWVFIPQAPRGSGGSDPAGGPARRGASFWLGVGLLTLGAIWFVSAATGPGGPLGRLDGGLIVPLALLGLGVALWRRSEAVPADTQSPDGSGWSPAGHPTPPSYPTVQPSPSSYPTWQPPPPMSAPPPASPIPPTPERSPMSVSTHPPASATDAASAAPRPPTGPPPGGTGSSGGDWTPPPVPPRERSLLTRATLGLTLLTVGVLWILELADLVALGPLRVLSIALAIVGGGLLVGSVAGRGRVLIVVGIALLPVVIVGSLLRGLPSMDALVAGDNRFGQIVERPGSTEEIDTAYRLGAGEFVVDLGDVDIEPGDEVDTSIEMGAGRLRVIVPADVDLEVEARLGVGELRVLDQRRSGLGLSLAVTDQIPGGDRPQASGTSDEQPTGDRSPVLTIDLNVGVGDVTIERDDS